MHWPTSIPARIFLLGLHNGCNRMKLTWGSNLCHIKKKTPNNNKLQLIFLQPFLRYHFFIMSFSAAVTHKPQTPPRNSRWRLIYDVFVSLCIKTFFLYIHVPWVCERRSVMQLRHLATNSSWTGRTSLVSWLMISYGIWMMLSCLHHLEDKGSDLNSLHCFSGDAETQHSKFVLCVWPYYIPQLLP